MASNSTTLSTAGAMVSQGAATIGGFVGQRQQAGAMLAQGAYTQRLNEWNAQIAQLQAQDAIKRGEIAAERAGTQTGIMIGAERAGTAAGNIDANSGTAASIQADTAKFGALDELTIRNNAARQAWGYQTEAMDSTFRGMMAAMSGRNQASTLDNASWGTLLTGGAQEAEMYGKYRQDRKGQNTPTGTRLNDTTGSYG